MSSARIAGSQTCLFCHASKGLGLSMRGAAKAYIPSSTLRSCLQDDRSKWRASSICGLAPSYAVFPQRKERITNALA